MLIETEPNGFMMVRYKLYFNQHQADPEDQWVFSYLKEHGLEPRRQLDEVHDGAPYKVWHFGQCYLGRHLATVGELYRRGIEHPVLAQHIRTLLDTADDARVRAAVTPLDDDRLHTVTTGLAAQLHEVAQFDTTEDNDLRVRVEAATVIQAFLDGQASSQTA